jgi:hypothetical protein
MKWTNQRREPILKELAAVGEFGAKAEVRDPKTLLHQTLPVHAHLNALEPDILLILGGRGAGKSHLFQVINLPDGPAAIGYKSQTDGATWLRGFSAKPTVNLDASFPDESVLQRFAQGKNRTDLVDFWRGLLAGAILNGTGPEKEFLQRQLPAPVIDAFSDLNRVSHWHAILVAHLEDVSSALNKLDDTLAQKNRFLFATYDDLDVMAVEWNEKRALIQALLQFWLGQWRRWRRIRPKIFLRRDLFSTEFLNFPDASKLEGNKLDLRWTPTQLYQLVFKLWANQGKSSHVFLRDAGLQFKMVSRLGWSYPRPWPTEEGLREVIHQMMSQFMGGGPKKGRTYEWIPNHLQDANGEIVPRSMLNLFSLAAQDELDNHRAAESLLLSPVSFGAAIEQVSERRIKELEEEYPWLSALRLPMQGQQVPITRPNLTKLLSEVDWVGVDRKPVSTDPRRLINDMLEIGILRLTTEQRIHVPDIYLYGFDLKRKGGIRRPKE